MSAGATRAGSCATFSRSSSASTRQPKEAPQSTVGRVGCAAAARSAVAMT